jgi:hypothetical protein
MKAICVSEFGDPEVLKLEDMPDPRPPQSGGVLVSVNAANDGRGGPSAQRQPGADRRYCPGVGTEQS